jgi:hypothetical protein
VARRTASNGRGRGQCAPMRQRLADMALGTVVHRIDAVPTSEGGRPIISWTGGTWTQTGPVRS